MLSSKLEVRIHDVLSMANMPFEEEYTFPDLVTSRGVPLRFDFAVMDDCGNVDFLIEAQGQQHYRPVGRFGGAKALRVQMYNDRHKRDYCRIHGIRLVEVPYTDYDRISYDYIMHAAGY